MARPTKQGLDWFPLDCQFDNRTQMFIVETGATGLAVLVCVWKMIYSKEGYYVTNDKDLHLLIKRDIGIGIDEISTCIDHCLSRGLFDYRLYEKYGILTSIAIQSCYFNAVTKRKKVLFIHEYQLIEDNSCNNLEFVYINPQNINNNQQIREDQSRKEDSEQRGGVTNSRINSKSGQPLPPSELEHLKQRHFEVCGLGTVPPLELFRTLLVRSGGYGLIVDVYEACAGDKQPYRQRNIVERLQALRDGTSIAKFSVEKQRKTAAEVRMDATFKAAREFANE